MSRRMSKVGAVIIGAGNSQRIGTDKMFLPLAGKPLLAWSVDTCQECKSLDQIVIVLRKENLALGQRLAAERGWSKVINICLGGIRRQDSVKIGIEQLEDCEWVLIHDGARPFLTQGLIQDGLEAASETGSAIAAVPAKDTIKLAENGVVKETLQRRQLWAAQTPQVFRFDIIISAYEQITDEVTDDASLVEHLGYSVKLYPGSYDNIKITTPDDMELAEIIMRKREVNAHRNRL